MRLLLGYFNSIKVQLEPSRPIQYPERVKFQFHKGTIRTLPPSSHIRSKPNFNSIKVQLEPLTYLILIRLAEISIP